MVGRSSGGARLKRHIPMLFDVRRMRGTEQRVERAYEAAAFEGGGDPYLVAKAVSLSFRASKKGNQYRLIGRVGTPLELSCSRCLEPYQQAVQEDFDLLYLPHSENRGEGEIEVEDDDLGIAFYREDAIDLGQLVREQLTLSVPMKPLCSEACRGLCPVCGRNLNLGDCQCDDRWVDPRLEALRSLRDRDRGAGT
jgi:uncharacterized protein